MKEEIVFYGYCDQFGNSIISNLNERGTVYCNILDKKGRVIKRTCKTTDFDKVECWVYLRDRGSASRYVSCKEAERTCIQEIYESVRKGEYKKINLLLPVYMNKDIYEISGLEQLCTKVSVIINIYRVPIDDIFLFSKSDENTCEAISRKINDYFMMIKNRVPTYFSEKSFHICRINKEYVLRLDKRHLFNEIIAYDEKNDCLKGSEIHICCEKIKLIDVVLRVAEVNEISVVIEENIDKFDKVELQFKDFIDYFFPDYPHIDKAVSYASNAIKINIDEEKEQKNNLAGNERRIIDEKGNELSYFVYGKENVDSMIIFSAYGVHLDAWKLFIEQYVDRYKIIIWNVRGINPGEIEKEGVWGVYSQIGDAELIMSNEKLTSFHVVSWCSGAKNALLFANKHHDKVLSLISIAGEFAPYVGSEAYHSKFRQNLEMISELIKNNSKLLDFYVKVIRDGIFNRPVFQYNDDLFESMFEIMPHQYREMLLVPFQAKETMLNFLNMCIEYYSHDISLELKKISYPTIFIAGEFDKIAPCMQSKWASVQVADSEYICICSATHFLILENIVEVSNILDWYIENVKE